MWLIYLVALIVGGGVLLVQIGSGFGHGLDHGIEHHPAGPGVLSTRAVTFGLLAFGMVGTPAQVLGLLTPGVAFVVAALSGLGGAVLAGLTFRRLGDPGASGAASLQEGKGQTARVIVACAPGRRGKVRLSVKGMVVDMVAVSQTEIPAGAAARILDVHDDVAQVEAAEEP
jgi:hypothetical protein